MNDDEEVPTTDPSPPIRGGSTGGSNEETPPSYAVIEAVAAATDRDPTELPPLQRTVDVDALDALLDGRTDSSIRLSFEYAGVRVSVDRDGVVDLSAD